jgi:hypothetical protein
MGFKYLWMKAVEGFDPSQHCARCLKGEYSTQVSTRMPVETRIELPYHEGEVLYLCGVSAPYIWDNNLHLAGVVTTGFVVSKQMYTGDMVIIEGIKELPIDASEALKNYAGRPKAFLTCRNFQFGAKYFNNVNGV